MCEHRYEDLVEALAFKRQWIMWREKVEEYTEGEGPFIKAAMDAVGLGSGAPFPPSRSVPEPLRAELDQLLARFHVPNARHVEERNQIAQQVTR